MLNFCDFIQVYVFTTNHHLNQLIVSLSLNLVEIITKQINSLILNFSIQNILFQ